MMVNNLLYYPTADGVDLYMATVCNAELQT